MGIKDDLATRVSQTFSQSWDIRDGRSVPNTEQVVLAGGGVRLDATVLYADLSQSSKLATDFNQRVAAKVIKAYLLCMCRLITDHDGSVTSFDGDRVMGIFIGESKNTNATKCALKMNYAVQKIIKPAVDNQFESIGKKSFSISHCVGVDTSQIMAVMAGQRGSNDIVWIGRAPNLAAKLSEIRNDPYRSYISGDVFSTINKSVKYSIEEKKLMWDERSYKFLGNAIPIYRSSWWWVP